MNINNNKENQDKQEQATIDKSKRSFSKAGIAAPILLSFASRPTWATGTCSFTQALSGNTSMQGPNPECVDTLPSAKSPSIYQQNRSDWESEYGVSNANFNAEFGDPDVQIGTTSGSTVTITNTSPTFEDILNVLISTNSNEFIFETNQVAAVNSRSIHYIAASLSAVSPVLIFPYTIDQIKDDWGTYALLSNLQAIHAAPEMTVADVANLGLTF